MEGQGSATRPSPEALEFEGRFMSSCPVTDSPFWWHHEQSAPDHHLPDFIPIHNGSSTDAGNNSVNQMVNSGSESTEHSAVASSSAHSSMNFLQIGIIVKDENNIPASTVTNSHPSDKRKSPEGCLGESSAMATKRSVINDGSSGSHAAPFDHIPFGGCMSSSSANINGFGSLETLSFRTLPPPRSSFFDIPPQPGIIRSHQYVGQTSFSRTNHSLLDSVPVNSDLHGTIISQNSDGMVQSSPPQTIGEGSNVQHHPMTLPEFAWNPSGPEFAMGTTQMEEMGFINSIQSLQLPLIVGPSNSANVTMTFRTSGGDASIAADTNHVTPSDPSPNIPVPAPNPSSNSYRRRRLELIRQALLDVDYFSGQSSNSHPGVQYGITPEIRQRLISRARNLITMQRGGRDISLFEDGVNARQSLVSALASIHDQHRDMRLDVDNMSYEELLELGERIGDVKTGLSEEAIIDSLKCTKHTFTMKFNQPNAEPCAICREDYAEGDDLGTLKCGHEYHTYCIKQWLVIKNSCPVCKAAASLLSK